MKTKICKECKKELSIDNFSKSKLLKDGYENKCKSCRNKARLKYECVCETCGKVWKAQKPNSKYCCAECKPQSKPKRIKTKCSYCSKEIEVISSKIDKFPMHYCSMQCKNKHYGELHKGDNNIKFNKIKVKCYTCGKEFLKVRSQVDKYKFHFCTLQCKNEGYKHIFSGKNNPNYNPSKEEKEREEHRNIDGYNEWIRNVFERDKYTCQCCGDSKGGNLNAHHKYNYSEHKELRTDISNGITLCERCHVNFHKMYGYKNNTQEQIEEFILNRQGNTELS